MQAIVSVVIAIIFIAMNNEEVRVNEDMSITKGAKVSYSYIYAQKNHTAPKNFLATVGGFLECN